MALINYVTQVQFGFGAIKLLAEECRRLNVSRPMIVTDAGVKAAGILEHVLRQLGDSSLAHVFDETPPNPNEMVLRKAVMMFREGGYDGTIAVGGGSSIDLAKGVAVCGTHDGPLKQ